MKVFLLDLNKECTSNSYLGCCLRDFFKRNGYEQAASYEEADAVFINGCNVVQSNWELAGAFRRFVGSGRKTRIFAFGCTPTLGDMEKVPGFHLLPLWQVTRDPAIVGRLLGAREPFRLLPMDEALAGVPFKTAPGRPAMSELAFVKISDGCLSSCTFCALRQAKGPVRSVPVAEVLAAVEAARAKGRRRFFLVSDDAGSWGADLGLDLNALLDAIALRVPDCELVSTTFNPSTTLPLMPALERHLPRFSYLSIPIQSGSDRILGLMDRGYTAASAAGLVASLRRVNPKLALNTDAIVGFPTETHEEFLATLRAAEAFDTAFFFAYAARPFTPAGTMAGAVPREEVRRRIEVLRTWKGRCRFEDDFRDEARGERGA